MGFDPAPYPRTSGALAGCQGALRSGGAIRCRALSRGDFGSFIAQRDAEFLPRWHGREELVTGA